MKQHTVYGQRMLDKVGGSMTDVGVIVRASHERWDGKGYPDGTAGEEIPLAARIVAVADTFSAITTTRSYRRAQTPEAAIEELRRCAGTQFDPRVVGAVDRGAAAARPRDHRRVPQAAVLRGVRGARETAGPERSCPTRSSSRSERRVDRRAWTSRVPSRRWTSCRRRPSCCRSCATRPAVSRTSCSSTPIASRARSHACRRSSSSGARLRETLPAFPPHLFASFVEVLETGVTLRTAIDLTSAQPPTRFAVSASRLGDGLLVVYEDVGARERVQATERRYGAVLEATSDWVSIADRDNNLVYINPAGRRMVGIGFDEDITGRRVGDFSPPWARQRVRPRGARSRAARRLVARQPRAAASRRARDPGLAGDRRAPRGRRRGRLLRHDRARHDGRAGGRRRAARERGALPRDVRAGADRHVAASISTGASCRSTTPIAGPSGARAKSSSSSGRPRSRTPTTSR